MFLILSILIIFTLGFPGGCSKETIPAQHLIGIWTTPAVKYRDRFIEITRDSLIFGVGNDQVVHHTITDIESEENGPETTYTIFYRGPDEQEWTLALTYNQENGGTLRLQNRDDIWKKEDH